MTPEEKAFKIKKVLSVIDESTRHLTPIHKRIIGVKSKQSIGILLSKLKSVRVLLFELKFKVSIVGYLEKALTPLLVYIKKDTLNKPKYTNIVRGTLDKITLDLSIIIEEMKLINIQTTSLELKRLKIKATESVEEIKSKNNESSIYDYRKTTAKLCYFCKRMDR